MFRELVSLTLGVLKLDSATISAHIERPDALKRGLLLILCVALLAGFFPFLGNLVGSFQPVDFAVVEQQIQQALEAQSPFNPALQDPEFRAMFDVYVSQILAIAKDISALPANVSFLPRGLERVLSSVGAWLSQPLARIAAWLGYALWVMLFVKLLGGPATLPRQLGAAALSVAPHALDLVTGLLNTLGNLPVAGPCLGGLGSLLGFVISVWGLVVYVKATALANGFGPGKATLAVVLPAVLGGLALFLLALVLGVFIVLGSARG